MKKILYPMIASDFDGTLSDASGRVPQETAEAVREYVEAGGIFAVITGRMLSSILPRVREMGLNGLVAAYQGTVIADIGSGAEIRRGAFTKEQTEDVLSTLGRLGLRCNLYSDEVLYTDSPEDDPRLRRYCEITGIPAVCVDGGMLGFVRDRGLSCQRVCCLTPPAERDFLYETLLRELGARFDVTYSAAVLVEIAPKGDDKGEALSFIAGYYGIPVERTVAVGDNLNDLPMLERAGVGVCVSGGDSRLSERAGAFTRSGGGRAVAEVIEEYGFEKD